MGCSYLADDIILQPERERDRDGDWAGTYADRLCCVYSKHGALQWKEPGLRLKLTVWQTGLSTAITCFALPGPSW